MESYERIVDVVLLTKNTPNRLKEMTLHGENEILPTVAASQCRNDYDWLCRSMLNEIVNGSKHMLPKEGSSYNLVKFNSFECTVVGKY